MTLSERIKAAREYAKLTQEELAKRVGVSQTAIHKLECGQSRSSRRTVAIALTCGINPVWLETGNGPKSLEASGMLDPDTADHFRVGEGVDHYVSTPRVPLLTWDQVGITATDEVETWVPVTRRVGSGSFALMVQGDSMESEFSDGDTIVVDPKAPVRHNCYVVVRMRANDYATFKQLIIDGGRRFLKPLNPRYPILEMEASGEICGVVVQKYKEY